MDAFPDGSTLHLVNINTVSLLSNFILQLQQSLLQLAIALLSLAKPSLQLVDDLQQVPLLPGQLVIHLIMTILCSWSQPSLMYLCLARSQRTLLGHHCLLQGSNGVVNLEKKGGKNFKKTNCYLLNLNNSLSLLIFQFPLSLLNLIKPF